jgi:DNA-binding response OmpR family regulator
LNSVEGGIERDAPGGCGHLGCAFVSGGGEGRVRIGRHTGKEAPMPERILVVDDEEGNRELAAAVLARAGYQVAQAADGPEALAAVAAAPPALVLLDLMMPGMDGLEVCRRLRAAPATAGLPVIVVTAYGTQAAKETALTSGVDDFVVKPFAARDLLDRVGALLRVRDVRHELDRTLAYLQEMDAVRHGHRRAALEQTLAPAAGPGPAPARRAAVPVLLVDDGDMTRRFYADLLTEHGYDVAAAASGPAALALLASHPVEVVVLDIVMPGMSGLEVLQRLQAERPGLPVIILTGHPTSQNAIAALKLGAVDFIVKGLDPALVALAVHRAVQRGREARAAQAETARLRAQVAALEGRPPTP